VLEEHWAASRAFAALARCALDTLDIAGARVAAERAVTLTERGGRAVGPSRVYALEALARACPAAGDPAQAEAVLAEAERLVTAFPDPGALVALVRSARADVPRQLPAREIAGALTRRELEVLQLLPSALSQREIGRELAVSMDTVKSHVRAIFRKLGVASREDAVRAARAAGVLEQGVARQPAGAPAPPRGASFA
jgi:LuxR family maltose regulon positive regulatory protein